MRIIRIAAGVLCIAIVIFALGFGIYQMWFDKVDAAMFRCSDNPVCDRNGDDCSGSVICTCTDLGTGFQSKCQFGHPSSSE